MNLIQLVYGDIYLHNTSCKTTMYLVDSHSKYVKFTPQTEGNYASQSAGY